MGFERAQRLDSETIGHRESPQALERAAEVPGKRTLVESQRSLWSACERPHDEAPVPGRQTGVALPAEPAVLGFDDYRVRALREVLGGLGCDPALRHATVAAADPEVARRTMPVLHGSRGVVSTTGAGGLAMWQVAERRAATLYRRAVDAGEIALDDPRIEAALARAGGGAPLPASVQRTLELELGASLERVRIHTDAVAVAAACALHAEAFTVGDDVFFAGGAFDPDSPGGYRLLAHELTHVVQGRQGRTDRGAGLRVSRPEDSLEQEADAAADRIHAAAAPGTAAPASGLPHAASIQRAFGRPDVPSPRTHVGAGAAASARAMGSEASLVQRRFRPAGAGAAAPGKPTLAGGEPLPEQLVLVVKQVTQLDLSDVRVHRDALEPLGIDAAAFAAGSHIFLAPGAEGELMHEVWHVVQQRQGRVARTAEIGGIGLNDDPGLEREADAMSAAMASAPAITAEGREPAGAKLAAPVDGAPVAQAKFREKHKGVWIDEETNEEYRVTSRTGKAASVERVRDGFRTSVKLATMEPIDTGPDHIAARLDTEHPWTKHLHVPEVVVDTDEPSPEDDVDDDKLVFEQVKPPIDSVPYLEGRGDRQKTRRLRHKKPSPFVAPVVLAPISGNDQEEAATDQPGTTSPVMKDVGEPASTEAALAAAREKLERAERGDGLFAASELYCAEVHASNERPPTRFEPYQKSHTVAWVLVRASIIAFTGHRLVDLLKFLADGFDELLPALQADAAQDKPADGNRPKPSDDVEMSVGEIADKVAPKLAVIADELEVDTKMEVERDAQSEEEEEEEEEEIEKDDELDPDDVAAANELEADDDQEEYDKLWKARQDPGWLAGQVVVSRELLATLVDHQVKDEKDNVDQVPGERLPLVTWINTVSEMVRAYEIARHKTVSAAFKKGPAKGRGEAAAMRRLRDVENGMARNEAFDINGYYKKVKKPPRKPKPTAISDFIGLLDVAFNSSLPPAEYKRAVLYWYRLFHLAFPRLAKQVGESVRKEFVAKRNLPKSLGGGDKKARKDLSSFLPDPEFMTDGFDVPEPQDKPHDIGGMDRTGVAGYVRLNPPVHEVRRTDVPRDEGFTLDQLEVGYVAVGEKRPKTQWGEKQYSHTVAWTLIRASVQSFARQRFANLFEFLLETAEELVDDLPEEILPKRGAKSDDDDDMGGVQQPRADAERCVAELQRWSGARGGLHHWHIVASHALIEVLRLYNLTDAAVYSKEAKGNNEGFAMQVLRENEAFLAAYGGLYDRPDYVAKKAQALLDVEVHHNLSWRDYARSVLHWEEHLTLAFPLVMSVGRDAIVTPILDRKLDGAQATWEDLPKGIPTVKELVERFRAEREAEDPRRITASAPAALVGANTSFRAQRTIPGDESGLHAFAQALVGLIVQHRLQAPAVAATLGAPPEVFAGVLRVGGAPDASSRRAVQRAMAPYLRRLAAGALAADPAAIGDLAAACVAEVERLSAPEKPVKMKDEGESEDEDESEDESEVPEQGHPLRDPASPLAAGLRELAAKVKAEIPASADDRPGTIARLVTTWANTKGKQRYPEAIARPGIAIGPAELAVLARLFGIQVLTFSDADEDGADAKVDVGAPNLEAPVTVTWKDRTQTGSGVAFTEGELEALVGAGLVEAKPERAAPRVKLVRTALAEAAETAAKVRAELETSVAERINALLVQHPVIGLRVRGGQYAAVTTEGGAFDLRSAEAHGGAGGWQHHKSRPLPEALEHEVDGTRDLPIEGTVKVAGKRHIVWQTSGDNNCAFNGMALVVMGLVAQGKIPAATLAKALAVEDSVVDGLGGDAANAPHDRAAARRIELALAGPLRRTAIEALRARKDLHHAMLDELVDEIRGRLYVEHGVPWVRVSDLFSDPGSALRGEIDAYGSDEALAKTVADKAVKDKECAIDAWINSRRAEIEAKFLEGGITQYLAGMKEDRVWGGGPELHALAGALGIHLTIFKDVGGGIVNRDEGVANVGSAPVAELGDESVREARVETLRKLELIEGKKLAAAEPMIYFKRVARTEVVQRLEGEPDLALAFLALYDQYCLDRGEPIEVGMYRHRARAHWSALSTEHGAFELQDEEDHLDGRAVRDQEVDRITAATWRAPTTSSRPRGTYRTANDTKRPAEGTFTSGGKSHIAWRTTGDDNCAFNGFAQVLIGLVAQNQIEPKPVADKLGLTGEDIAELQKRGADQQKSSADARAVEKALSMRLRKLAAKALRERAAFHASMAEELVDELRGLVYAKHGCPWARASDLFTDSRSSLKKQLHARRDGSDAELAASCKGKSAAEKIKLIDAWIEKVRADLTDWFTRTGIGLYCDDMQQDRVWGGGPELHALAAELGIHVTIFKDIGGGLVASDEGSGSAGRAPADGLSAPDIEQLRAAELIEGHKVTTHIYFKRLARDEVEQRAAKLSEELRKRFLPLWEANYAYRDAPPVEVGMFRHRERAHWSAATTDKGAYALNDATDHLKGEDVPKAAVDSFGHEDYDLAYALAISAAESKPAKPGGKTKNPGATATASFQFVRRDLKGLPGGCTLYADHWYGGKNGKFQVASVDPTKQPGEDLALVNAANESLRGGGGIDGAIKSLEGTDPLGRPSRHAEIDQWEKDHKRTGLGQGEAMTTSGGDLKGSGVSAVIHTVGPRDTTANPKQVLEACVDSVMLQASAHVPQIHIVVFCNISSDLFGLKKRFTGTVIQDRLEALLAAPPAAWNGWLPAKIVFNNFPKTKAIPKPTGSDGKPDGKDGTSHKGTKRRADAEPDPEGTSFVDRGPPSAVSGRKRKAEDDSNPDDHEAVNNGPPKRVPSGFHLDEERQIKAQRSNTGNEIDILPSERKPDEDGDAAGEAEDDVIMSEHD